MVVLWFYLGYLLQASGLLRGGEEWSAEVGAELPVCPPHVSAEVCFFPRLPCRLPWCPLAGLDGVSVSTEGSATALEAPSHEGTEQKGKKLEV